ncbi:MAG: hypothetical protein HC888_00090 [Candidatus Competibacteraceae bacterium]|nr:hypothetical protein [Candidatus Competibacteraceae bacterium]
MNWFKQAQVIENPYYVKLMEMLSSQRVVADPLAELHLNAGGLNDYNIEQLLLAINEVTQQILTRQAVLDPRQQQIIDQINESVMGRAEDTSVAVTDQVDNEIVNNRLF